MIKFRYIGKKAPHTKFQSSFVIISKRKGYIWDYKVQNVLLPLIKLHVMSRFEPTPTIVGFTKVGVEDF